MRIAVTGASGYIGGRLVPRLLDEGHDVVCLARRPDKLNDRAWRSAVEVRRADVMDRPSLDDALAGCEIAYYLVHSMGSSADFQTADRVAAGNFADAAEGAGVQRIIYLGGLGEESDELSTHLTSRHEVGHVLAEGTTPVTEMRAAVIIGSGSVSFEMLRYLTEVLPAMITPSWVRTRCQPIAIRDVLTYLVAGLHDAPGSHVYELGGPDILTYRDMMRIYAEVAGLPRRVIVPVPVLTPKLSSYWVGLVTPLPAGVARPLVDSLRNEVIVRSDDAQARFSIPLVPFRGAVELALERSQALDIETRWSDASTSPAQPFDWDPSWAGGTLFVDRQRADCRAKPSEVFAAFARVGGDHGYYVHDWAWRLRGLIDSAVGGVGLRRGRRHPQDVRLHDPIDFWRVSAIEPGRLLQLSAEMKLPGDAWLEWRIDDDGDGPGCVLQQAAYFRPRGLMGRLYWYTMLPFHHLIFRSMVTKIAAAAPVEKVGDAA